MPKDKKITKSEALYYSWLIWETMLKENKKNQRLTMLKQSVWNLIHKTLPKHIRKGVSLNYNCPCCLYMVQGDGDYKYSHCTELCPGLSLWGKDPYGAHKVGVPCEHNIDSPYRSLMYKHLACAEKETLSSVYIKEIATGFWELYKAEITKE